MSSAEVRVQGFTVRMTSTNVAAGDNDDARRVRARGQGGAPRRGASDKHSCRL